MKKMVFTLLLVVSLIISTFQTSASAEDSLTPLDKQLNKFTTGIDLLGESNKSASNAITTVKNLSFANVMAHYPPGSKIRDKEELRLFLFDVTLPDLGAEVQLLNSKKTISASEVRNNFDTMKQLHNGNYNEWNYVVKYTAARQNLYFWKLEPRIIVEQLPTKNKKGSPTTFSSKTKYTFTSLENGYIFEGPKSIQNIKTFLTAASGDLVKRSKLVCYVNEQGKITPRTVTGNTNIINFLSASSQCKSQRFQLTKVMDGDKEFQEIILTDLNAPVKSPLLGSYGVDFGNVTQKLTITAFDNGVIRGNYQGENGLFNVIGKLDTKTGMIVNRLYYSSKEHMRKDLRRIEFNISVPDSKLNQIADQLEPELRKPLLPVFNSSSTKMYQEFSFPFKNGKFRVDGSSVRWKVNVTVNSAKTIYTVKSIENVKSNAKFNIQRK